MPVIAAVTPLSHPGLAAAGDCLRGMDQGNLDACDLMIVPVGPDGQVAADEALDAILALPAADIVTAAKLTGKAGQSSEAAARVGQSTVRIVFLGVGDRSPRALRRAGGEIGRMLQPGDRAVSSVVAGQPALVLGCRRSANPAGAGICRGCLAGLLPVLREVHRDRRLG